MEPNQESKMINNWETYLGLVNEKLSADLSKKLSLLLEENAEKIITAPASSRTSYVGAFPGGFVWHSLNVLRNMKELNKVYNLNLTTDEMIIVALFHDFGKIGTVDDEDYYVAPKSAWHKENGSPFQINHALENISVSSLSLMWLNNYNVPLSHEVIEAIISTPSMTREGFSNLFKTRPLTMALQQSIQAASVANKGKEKL